MISAIEVREKLFEILNDMGIICDTEKIEEDIDLREYIEDSIVFIGFIVEIEAKFNFELDDSALLYDNLQSLNGFVKMLEGYINDNQVHAAEF